MYIYLLLWGVEQSSGAVWGPQPSQTEIFHLKDNSSELNRLWHYNYKPNDFTTFHIVIIIIIINIIINIKSVNNSRSQYPAKPFIHSQFAFKIRMNVIIIFHDWFHFYSESVNGGADGGRGMLIGVLCCEWVSEWVTEWYKEINNILVWMKPYCWKITGYKENWWF